VPNNEQLTPYCLPFISSSLSISPTLTLFLLSYGSLLHVFLFKYCSESQSLRRQFRLSSCCYCCLACFLILFISYFLFSFLMQRGGEGPKVISVAPFIWHRQVFNTSRVLPACAKGKKIQLVVIRSWLKTVIIIKKITKSSSSSSSSATAAAAIAGIKR